MMNKRNLRFHLYVCSVAMASALTATAQAANRPLKFTVPDSQIQALGIQTAPLQSQSDLIKVRFPAEVVVPTTAKQIVSSPVAGLVAQLLVQQNQAVRPGTPLVRIASPELGQLQLQLLQATARAKLARQSALTYKARENGIIVMEDFTLESPKTKNFISLLKSFDLQGKKVLMVLAGNDKNVYLSSRNIQKTKITDAASINTYDILNANSIIMAESSLKEIEKIHSAN